jgi:CubicO group peptidase (beta-lactamase class C family)
MRHRRRMDLPLVAAVATVLLLVGCTTPISSPARSPEPSATAAQDPRSDAVSEVTQAQVDAAIADLPNSVQAAMQASGTPGIAVGVVWNGELVFAEGYGVRNVDTGDPVDPDTVFPLASVSKSLAATTVARVIDEGTLTWDTPVVTNLPEFALSDPYVGEHVTIADMFAHRSGLYEHVGDELEEIGYDRAAIIERLRLTPLEPWRATYHYGNFDLTTAAESVARAKGEDWAALSDRVLYQPLGMTSPAHGSAILSRGPTGPWAMCRWTTNGWSILSSDSRISSRPPAERAPA